MKFFKILAESFRFAFHALAVNKLRSLLSLAGITIGILVIVMVFTIVDSLERNIRDSLSQLGSDVIYVQKWPFGGGGEYPWWKYFQRPEPSFNEFRELENRITSARYLAYGFGMNKTAKYRRNYAENSSILSVSHDYYQIWTTEFDKGRYFSVMESKTGAPVAVIGKEIALGLFGMTDPIGREIKIMGRKVRVIGVFERQGQSLVGNDVDGSIVVPVKFTGKLLNINDQNGTFIMAMVRDGVSMQKLRDDLTGAMRSIRRLKPRAENNFALNEISMISGALDSFFGVIGTAGAVIGLFSILVGGFGIANIMFVSVKERTNQIGIQKSLGAKNYFILSQFLLESILLCLIGGTVGILMVGGLTYIVGNGFGFDITLSINNIMQGVVISLAIGVVSGFVPAYSASRLNPVDAIRSGQ